ncbi:MAG: site-specific recombinase [Geobacter sp.]|nr:site-specific recombinase [Geobacter sp.]
MMQQPPEADCHQDPILQALENLTTASDDLLPLLIALFDAVRPERSRNHAEALQRWRRMLQLLEAPRYYDGLRTALLTLFAQRRQISLYSESGLLPNTGFFSELHRKLVHRLLPELADPAELRDCIRLLFHRPYDAVWINAIPLEEQRAFWKLLTRPSPRMLEQISEACLVLSHRICAMGLEPELLRVLPQLKISRSPFLALHEELAWFTAEALRLEDETSPNEEDKRHLLVLTDQCHEVVRRAHQQATAVAGTSMSLTFLLTRLEQHLQRLELLMEVLAIRVQTVPDSEVVERWSGFLADAVLGELRRNSLRQHFADLAGQMALLVTENAARTGEHYIASDRQEWWGMLRAAAGAGVIIALLALVKIKGAGLHLPILSQGLLNGLIYGGGFLLVHLLHFTIATKQPAMTAAAIAATVSQTKGKLRDQERLLELMVSTARSQFAAVLGNVGVAFPLALVIGLTAGLLQYQPVSLGKARTLALELNPFTTLSLFYAAIAGIWLFVTGLISGYIDNLSAHSQIGPRIARLPWLQRIAGTTGAERIGSYISSNAGGLTGNLFFGLMLGVTPAVGQMLGLPLDIRHIAFSAANIGYAVATFNFVLQPSLLLSALAGVMLIGLINLLVSFSLALWVAMRSRGVSFRSVQSLFLPLRRRLFSHPLEFMLPVEPRQESRPPQ